MAGATKYPVFSVTADILVLRRAAGELQILLIQRKKNPYRNRWALPGGFLDADEDALGAARRELREETGLKARRLVEVGAFSDPKRDPRGRVVSVAFYTLFTPRSGKVKAGDDAGRAEWFSVKHLPRLAFDHRLIIRRGIIRYHSDRI